MSTSLMAGVSGRGSRAVHDPVVGSPNAGDGAFTLVEMLVSLVILGVILAASAASLITFTQTAREDERRAQATALLSQAHERFQALPWETLGSLPEDLEGLGADEHFGDALDLDALEDWIALEFEDETDPVLDPVTFRDDQGEIREVAFTGNEEDALPAYEGPFTANDGRNYELYQLVLWVDTTGDGNPDLKRLYATVRWKILERDYEQVFVSDRAPSVQEVGDAAFPRLLQYDTFPITQDLLADQTASEDVDVAVRFSEGVTNVRLRFYSVNVSESEVGGPVVLQEETISLGPPLIINPFGDGGVYFVGQIPRADAYVFPPGPRPVQVVADTADNLTTFVAGTRDLRFIFDSDADPAFGPTPDPGTEPPEENGEEEDLGTAVVETVLINSPNPARLVNASGSRLLCTEIVVDFTISSGLEETDSVQLNYFTGNQGSTPATTSVSPTGSIVDGAASFSVTFNKTDDHGFRNSNSTAFTAQVIRESQVVGSKESSTTILFDNTNQC